MENSKVLFEKSLEKIPGGVNSPVRAFGSVGGSPLFIKSANADHIYDVDGNEFIDYVCSWGPGILGHAHPQVIEAVKKACVDGLTFGAPTKKELELAELITDAMPSIEKVRLVNSGTEATMSAIRTARGYTGRDMIIKFRGNYHGHSDGLLVKAGSAALTTAVPDSAGVPASYTQNTLVAEYNNEDSVRELMEQYGENVAAIIVEPVAANMGVVPPKEGFLKFLRDITLKYGTVLIFDEVITGFRLKFGGAQEYFGVKPDMTTLGKIVGGGMPIAAYGGKKEIMDRVSPTGPVYQAGTLSGNPIATTAGIETLKILKAHPEYYKQIDESAKKLADAYRKMAKEKNIPLHVNQIGSLLSAFQTGEVVDDYDSALTSDTNAYTEYFWKMLDNGIYVAPAQFEAMFVSVAHTKEDIERTCEVISL
ncbi:glutamate-1-semialdehyde-2,1-aminomutase [Clostridium sp. AF34-13]|uniref:Glutamate-1-semialdehyde 2,1-aminomutase n=2 Tax=Bacillota TaxID=1239 RepID=A0AAW3JTZ5_9FIRM|nr:MULTISPECIES: glutamate-1-semialdehyde 2,1-aminomutase [Clostridia]KQC85615.1 glutamate-1-semialdehyde aminotransferase [Butyribacter intestini]RHP24958.1 glutamate-1-semialdehyde-2,1-aminomutase [Clostridium sp. AF34-13]RHU74897.1 glutamate-1-semialdehyde-2,1-aminomutase [Butyribacter intestini]UYJ42100.1 MAG: glutamate-1-semialdehyde 2,1-aminomutase [Lachnospiraceae bacterium]